MYTFVSVVGALGLIGFMIGTLMFESVLEKELYKLEERIEKLELVLPDCGKLKDETK